jgi:predicted TIM-barrel fold metal-dependent hydrolase
MIIDTHCHIASWPTVKESEDALRYAMKAYHISFMLVSDCDCAEYPSVHRYKEHRVTQLQGLKRVLSFVKTDPAHLGAAVWINPHHEKVTPELHDYIANNRDKIFALKVHPYESHIRMTDPRLEPYLELAGEFLLPIIVHTAQDKWSDVRFLATCAQKHPDLRFVAAHMQLQGDNNLAVQCLRETPNLYGDTAWVDMKVAKKVLIEIGEDRMMFGTDNPIDGGDTYNNPIYQAYFRNKNKLPGHLYRNLMARNAIALFSLPVNGQ